MSPSESLVQHLLGHPIPFPAKYAWFLEARWRRWVLSPERLAERLVLSPQLIVCEIGIGGGYYARPLAPAVGLFAGLDLQLPMLARVRKKSRATNLLLVQGNATALPFATGSLDLIIATTVLGEVPSRDATLAEALRALKPGGTLAVSEHLPDPDFLPFPRVLRLCRDHGFQLEARYGYRWNYTAVFRAPTRLG